MTPAAVTDTEAAPPPPPPRTQTHGNRERERLITKPRHATVEMITSQQALGDSEAANWRDDYDRDVHDDDTTDDDDGEDVTDARCACGVIHPVTDDGDTTVTCASYDDVMEMSDAEKWCPPRFDDDTECKKMTKKRAATEQIPLATSHLPQRESERSPWINNDRSIESTVIADHHIDLNTPQLSGTHPYYDQYISRPLTKQSQQYGSSQTDAALDVGHVRDLLPLNWPKGDTCGVPVTYNETSDVRHNDVAPMFTQNARTTTHASPAHVRFVDRAPSDESQRAGIPPAAYNNDGATCSLRGGGSQLAGHSTDGTRPPGGINAGFNAQWDTGEHVRVCACACLHSCARVRVPVRVKVHACVCMCQRVCVHT